MYFTKKYVQPVREINMHLTFLQIKIVANTRKLQTFIHGRRKQVVVWILSRNILGQTDRLVLQDKTRIVGESLTLWALSWPFLAC